MLIYIDITQLEKRRANTGIQRVVKEFLKRAAVSTSLEYKIIIENEDIRQAKIVKNDEVADFLNDIKNYQFKETENVNLLTLKPTSTTAFFDLDANWNIVLKREYLYPILKNNGFLIFNFIYDLIPIILPEFAHETTAKNFKLFIDAVYKSSDLVLFDSFSAQSDFLQIKNEQNIKRHIPTRAIGLGSDFLQVDKIPQDDKISQILAKKYILFVGTLEPRKNQADVLTAFECIAKKYPDLNLVLIGKKGWHVESLIQKILSHPLKDRQVFWLDDIDDNTLSQFYQNAFLVTYLSKYEGYGLPIAESLSYGNITITSKNSSMYEVGQDAADYVVYNSLNELVSLITLYCDNSSLYKAKKRYIKENFKTTSWEQFYLSISDIFVNFEKSILLRNNHLDKLQFVFISIDKHNLEGTIASIDTYVDFVSEYVIVTQKKLIKSFQNIVSKNKITIIDESTILGQYKQDFSSKDHQSKNWLLRASLINLDILDEEFIMLDDDNRVLKNISIDKFINKDGSYNAYYFYTLLDWTYCVTEYDKGQQNMKKVLGNQNYELLSYSSHAPQIINKTIFKEAVKLFFDAGLKTPLDEWSIYFNYAVSMYPYSFNKKVYETLNWPANPTHWEGRFNQSEITFENYYKELYDISFFNKEDTYEQKLNKKENQLKPYLQTQTMFEQSLEIFSKNNMVHETLAFKTKDAELYLSNIPYFVVVEQNSDVKLKFNCKIINLSFKKMDMAIVVFLDGNYRTLRQIDNLNDQLFQEFIVEFPIISNNLPEDIYDLSFNLMINNNYVFSNEFPYKSKLIVVKEKNLLEVLGNPQMIQSDKKQAQNQSIKNKLKSIPILGWIARWSNNLLHLNNIKHRVHVQQRQIEDLKQQLYDQQLKIDTLLQSDYSIDEKIAQTMSFQVDSFQERIDQFLFDAKINLKNEKH